MQLNNDQVIFSFDKNNDAIVKVNAPITMDISTLDCFSNQLRNPEDTMEQLDWDATNPATGPLYINGAKPGDTLKVTINEIKVDEKGTVCCIENEGTLGHLIKGAHIKIVNVKEGYAQFAPDITIPLNPMIGVIGVAPKGNPVNAGTPGKHGGNMDNKMITEGATIYFPINTDGALFALGDVHGAMGDGEIGVSGLEIPATINLTIDLIEGKAPEFPVLENEDTFSIIASEDTVDEAIVTATELMEQFIEERTDLETKDVIMLMSLVGNVEICQVVDPKKTVRYVFPKEYLKNKYF